MIDQCGFKGATNGGAQVYNKQPLVIVNASGNASPEEIIGLEKRIIDTIAAKYGIDSSNISIVGEDINAGVALSAILMADTPFKAAVAVSPVTDLRTYNPVVTQRIMRMAGATSAYRLNSAVDNASKLEKKLLILHSAGDDVTPLSNTEALCNALVDSGVQFDMQVFFSGGRGMTSGLANNYTITKIYNYIK